jgi:hypothetical protein
MIRRMLNEYAIRVLALRRENIPPLGLGLEVAIEREMGRGM